MNDPYNTMRGYFDNLVNRYQMMESLLKQTTILSQWRNSPHIEALHLGWHFYTLVSFSFARTVLVEICNFVSEKEERSLVDWLNKAAVHAKAIKPTKYIPNSIGGDREPVSIGEYRTNITEQLGQLGQHSVIFNRLRIHRDKAIAHADSCVFDNPKKHYKEYPLNIEELAEVLGTIKDILTAQYSYIHGISSSLDIMSLNNVDSVISKSYAFWLARRDPSLLEKGIFLNKYSVILPKE